MTDVPNSAHATYEILYSAVKKEMTLVGITSADMNDHILHFLRILAGVS